MLKAALPLLLIVVLATADMPPIVFNEDGSFKILHISDTHYETDEGCICKDV